MKTNTDLRKSINKISKLAIGLAITSFCVGMAVGTLCYKMVHTKKQDVQINYNYVTQNDTINKAVFFEEIKKVGCNRPIDVYNHGIRESGGLKSYMALNYNNLFGMTYPNKRKTTAIGKDPKGWAIYKNWKDSVLDYKIMMEPYNDYMMKFSVYDSFLKSIKYF